VTPGVRPRRRLFQGARSWLEGGQDGGPAATAAAGQAASAGAFRDFLSGELTPVAPADVMAVLRAREAGGAIRLVSKPAG
jgi:hypothetical protein